MCGIFGICYLDYHQEVNEQMVIESTNTMAHRGPDDCGFYVDKHIGLGHRRLSIIDLSTGRQPMTNEDEQIITVYNGEIYNYKEIRQTLIALGHQFRTDCDTEVIVHGYEEWGTECINRFIGMFAFILWDKRENRFFVVRDRIGIKPLYYYFDNDLFLCASEIKAILKTGLIKAELNENVLDAFFSIGYVPGSETMFKNIRKVLPGHFITIEGARISEVEYWDFCDVHQKDINFAEATRQVKALIADSIEKRLVSDVPLGVFLSGGLDSSVVTGMMSQLTNDPVNTFTVAYKDGFSEDNYAKIVADAFQTNHHKFYLEPDNFFSSLQTLIGFAEEPIVEPAAIALYHLSKLARKSVTVLLSGEGSDEIFAGYYLYKFMLNIEKAQKFTPKFVYPLLRALEQFSPKDKYRKYIDWLMLPLKDRYQGTSSYLTPSLKKRLYSTEFFNDRSCYLHEQFAGHYHRVKHLNPLAQMLYVDTKTWLVDDLLVKADKMTMAASVELRVPFLDHRLVESVFSLPSHYKLCI